jgi:hypothetical protein
MSKRLLHLYIYDSSYAKYWSLDTNTGEYGSRITADLCTSDVHLRVPALSLACSSYGIGIHHLPFRYARRNGAESFTDGGTSSCHQVVRMHRSSREIEQTTLNHFRMKSSYCYPRKAGREANSIGGDVPMSPTSQDLRPSTQPHARTSKPGSSRTRRTEPTSYLALMTSPVSKVVAFDRRISCICVSPVPSTAQFVHANLAKWPFSKVWTKSIAIRLVLRPQLF